LTIGFWKTKRENFATSSAKGLDELQVKMLQSLKPGDRLALWTNTDKEGEHRADYTLKVLVE